MCALPGAKAADPIANSNAKTSAGICVEENVLILTSGGGEEDASAGAAEGANGIAKEIVCGDARCIREAPPS